MGTSNLYNGPKGKALLPDGYVDPFDDEGVDNPSADSSNEDESQNDGTGADNNIQGDAVPIVTQINSTGSWTSAKKSYNNLFKDHSSARVHRAVKKYVKALGGHEKAARQAHKAKKVTSSFIDLFGGGSDHVKKRLTELGIQFDGRPTKDIFQELLNRDLFLPPSIRDNALAHNALVETISDLFESDVFTPDSLEMFDSDALQYLICTYLKHYIFDKMIEEVSRKELMRPMSEIKSVEDDVFGFISSCIDVIIPKFIKENNIDENITKKVNDIYNSCYKQLEEGLIDNGNSSKDKSK